MQRMYAEVVHSTLFLSEGQFHVRQSEMLGIAGRIVPGHHEWLLHVAREVEHLDKKTIHPGQMMCPSDRLKTRRRSLYLV